MFIISHYSAFLMYRYLRLKNIKTTAIQNTFANQANFSSFSNASFFSQISTEEAKTMIAFLKNYENPGLPLKKLDILCFEKTQRKQMDNLQCHAITFLYPKGMFVKINIPNKSNNLFSKIILPSSEMLTLQLAKCFHGINYLKAIMELFGSYVNFAHSQIYNLQSNFTNFKNNLPPTTTKENCKNKHALLQQHAKINDVLNLQGLRTYYKNVHCLGENSASPAETNLYILLCEKHINGGYGIKDLIMNHKILLSDNAFSIYRKKFVVADLCNPQYKIVIEYDSRTFHSQIDATQADKKRINALELDGWRVYSIVPDIMQKQDSMGQIAKSILKQLHQPTRIRVKNFRTKNAILLRELWNSN